MRCISYCASLLSTKGITKIRKNKVNCNYTLIFSRQESSNGMKVLNVAEKNDAAKNIANILSRGNSRRKDGLSVYNKIYEFNAHLWNQDCLMVMTSVSGHLLGYEFVGTYRKWQGCHPLSLFEAPVVKQCCDDNYIKIKKTIEREVRSCNALIIWTDCDREGENIGFEVIEVCQAIKPNIRVYRAKFSEITSTSINRALATLDVPNKAISDAVDVRSELDLRIGAAFTRFQTLRLQKVFPRTLADMLISYGSCQFPTLGFVVERFLAIERFKAEPYWKIKVTDVRGQVSVEFRWARIRLFEELPCRVLLDMCLERPDATVQKITSKPKSKWRPVPLDTIELEKQGSRKLRLNAKETMKIAEKLYTQGFISYPRTETNIFPKELNLVPLVTQQTDNPSWGSFAQRLLQDGLTPRQGKKSDMAHPPIHPTKYASSLQGNEAKVYEFIVRHFLACLSKNAEGQETIVDIDIAGEKFTASGLQIIAKNYLEVYIYEKWSDKEIHTYQERQVFRPTSVEMIQEETSPPSLLTEADLIALMDKHGIGTDATHAEHIDTIKSRQYVGLTDGQHFIPGKLGIGLVMGYDNMGFAMSKPNLRADLEKDLKLICDGVKDPKDVLQNQINKYRDVFKVALEHANLIDGALASYLDEQPVEVEQLETRTIVEDIPIFKCPKCNNNMILKNKRDGRGKFIGCIAYPTCNTTIWLPETVEEVTVLNGTCTRCTGGKRKLKFKLARNAFPIFGTSYTTCIGGCDPDFNEMLGIRQDCIRRSGNNDSGYSSTTRPSANNQNSTALSRSSQASNRSNMLTNTRNINQQNTSNTMSTANTQPSVRRNENRRPTDNRKKQNNDKFVSTNTINEPRNRRVPSAANAHNNDDFNKTWGKIDNDAVIMCNCHENAIQLTVRKEGPNQGRLFYKCAKPQGTGCDFFMWAADDDANARPSASTSHFDQSSTANSWRQPSRSESQTRSTAGNSSTNWGNISDVTSSSDMICHCTQPARKLTVHKEGPNKGRQFYTCPKGPSSTCNFFKWADEEDENTNSRQSNTQMRNRGRGRGGATKNTAGGTKKRKCGICGIEGHTRKTCPQNVMD